MKKNIIVSALFLLILAYYIMGYLHDSKTKDIELLTNNSRNVIATVYNSILNTHQIVAEKDMHTLLQNRAVMQLLQKFKYADDENKSITRGKIYRTLYREYDLMRSFNIRQFHFHTHDGKSLLRFHQPSQNGDSLIDIKESVRVANILDRNISGFESGRIYPGFRYVFPIHYDGEHLGSVEFSIAFESIEKELATVLPNLGYQLNLSNKISYDKVFPWYREYFIPSIISSDYCIENPKISSVTKKLRENQEVNKLLRYIKNNPTTISSKIKEERSFTIPVIINNIGYMIHFIAIKDTLNRQAAYLIAYLKFDQLAAINQKYFTFSILLSIALLSIFFLIVIVIRQLANLSLQKENLQYLLDLQEQIVILTSGVTLNYANQKFFEFFHLSNLQEFLNKHQCICEKFIHDNRFFHLGKVVTNQNWIEAIKLLPSSKRVVAMVGEDLQIYSFAVAINIYANDIYIISFTDISDTIAEQIKLREKILRDKLTGASNREYFEKNIESIVAQYTQQNSHLALGMLDIDFFKNVNDTYGHAVGDSVLVELVKLIKKSSRESDMLIRWGGEEFILLVRVSAKEGLDALSEHLRQTIEKHFFAVIGHITCSIGYSLYKEGEDITETIKRADEALYQAKNSGRNRVVIV